MRHRHLWRGAVAAVVTTGLIGLVPTIARAQAPEGTKTPVANQQIISANPFGLMFEWFNVEYERKWRPSLTWGASASWFSLGGGAFDYVNANGLVRYYPQGAALTGFYLGGRGGVFHVSHHAGAAVFCGLGFEIGYDWLLGSKRNFGISLGAGATRLFGGTLDGASLTVPTLRLLNIGIAF